MTANVAILGASGYTGAELVRLIATHPGLRITALSADRKAGMQMAEVFPFLRHLDLPRMQQPASFSLGPSRAVADAARWEVDRLCR